MSSLWLETRVALRAIGKRPGFSATVILTFALGIGANSAMFSVLNGVLLRPLPYPDASRVVRVYSHAVDDPETDFKVASYPEFLDVAAAAASLETVGLYNYTTLTLTGFGEPTSLAAARASAGLFDVLGARTVAGRTFLDADDRPGAPAVVLLSHHLWVSRFGRDASILGRSITLNRIAYEVIGILDPAFRMPSDLVTGDRTDVWVPVAAYAAPLGRGIRRFAVYGRLADGATLERGRAELGALGERLAATYPETSRDVRLGLAPAKGLAVAGARSLVPLLLGAVTLVLLIGCANVANMLLARATTRDRETAIRAALGAGRRRLAFGAFVESAVLASLGGATGLLVAQWTLDALRVAAAGRIPRLAEVGIDGTVLAFTAGLILVTAALASVGPVLHGAVVGDAGRWHTSGLATRRARNALVVFEIAVGFPLLAAAGLLLNSLWRLQRVDPGLETARAVTLTLSLPREVYADDRDGVRFYHDLLARLRMLPGVEDAGATTALPLGGGSSCDTYAIADRPDVTQPCVEFRVSTPGYARALGVPLLEGRWLTDQDTERAPPVAVVSEAMAVRLWPNESAVGKRIKYGGVESTGPWHTVVGVIGDVRQLGLDAPPAPEFHLPHAQVSWPREMTVVVRSTGGPEALAAAIRRSVSEIDPDLPVPALRSMDEVVTASVADPRFRSLVIASFAGMALVLAAVGIYAVTAYSVGERTRELGIRMALGARANGLRALVVLGALRLVSVGVLIGLVASLWTGRLVGRFLFGVGQVDPPTLAIIALVVLICGVLGSYVPARRATRIDPLEVLRHE